MQYLNSNLYLKTLVQSFELPSVVKLSSVLSLGKNVISRRYSILSWKAFDYFLGMHIHQSILRWGIEARLGNQVCKLFCLEKWEDIWKSCVSSRVAWDLSSRNSNSSSSSFCHRVITGMQFGGCCVSVCVLHYYYCVHHGLSVVIVSRNDQEQRRVFTVLLSIHFLENFCSHQEYERNADTSCCFQMTIVPLPSSCVSKNMRRLFLFVYNRFCSVM